MAGRHAGSCKVIAAVFIILLAGAECARINEQVALSSASREYLASQRLVSDASEAGVFWHNDVCRSGDMKAADGAVAVHRYKEKYLKVVTLAGELRDTNCSASQASCALKWFELKSRVIHFQSCITLVAQEDGTKVPETLVETMAEEQTSLTRVFTESLSTASSAMQKTNLFPASDNGKKCKFDPAGLRHVTSYAHEHAGKEDASSIMREVLFGQECDEAALQEYRDSLKGLAKQTVDATMKMIDRLLDWARAHDFATQQTNSLNDQLKIALKEAEDITADTNADSKLIAKKLEQAVEKKEANDDDEQVAAALLEIFDMNLDSDLPETAGEWMQFLMANIINVVLIFGLAMLTLFLLYNTNWATAR